MNKTKLILPLFVVAPVLFGCSNENVTGVYTLDTADKIDVKFIKGSETDYNTAGFKSLNEVKSSIYDKFNYGDGTIHLDSEPAIPSKTESGEDVTSYPVNLKDGTISFEYGKIKSGYHFRKLSCWSC